MNHFAEIAWDKGQGLVPAVVQHADSGLVLMLGYMNEAALQKTLETGLVTFYSRSKQRLWTKGETSGNVLQLRDLKLDCDQDTLLIQALPQGPTCHTGSDSCWDIEQPKSLLAFRTKSLADSEALPKQTDAKGREALDFLQDLDQLLDQRFRERPEGSYTTKLFAAGLKRMAQKVGEEGVEVALAAQDPENEEFLGEAADLVFHLMVLLRAKDLHLSDVVQVLKKRHRPR